jgi:ATP-binding cassette subfamily F protein 3
MLRIMDITYSVEGRPLFEGATATIPYGHKVGLVGRNGTGKTTLFRLIRGELALEGGEITLPSRSRIGGVAQEVPSSATSLLDTVLQADTERAALIAEAETATDPHRIAEVQARLADIDAWSAEGRASAILKGLGFDAAAQLRPCCDFSGGWRMRCCCWTSRRTTLIWKGRCGWKAIWRSTPTASSSSAMTGAC